jgi:Icc-related predicted phosphoesterase
MMQINFMSDLHLEFGPLEIEPGSGDVLVLAGDIDIKARVNWINDIARRFRHVIYVLGNHEFYHGAIDNVYTSTRAKLVGNVHLLENESITISGVTFHGATLWSDFLKGHPMSYLQCDQEINDYRLIRAGAGKHRFNPQIAHSLHNISKVFLKENVTEGDVVVTHMAPSLLSIHEKYQNDMNINGSFASDLSKLILETKPELWFHGHMHDSIDYTIGNTRILCNPRGYVGQEENPEFDPNALVGAVQGPRTTGHGTGARDKGEKTAKTGGGPTL